MGSFASGLVGSLGSKAAGKVGSKLKKRRQQKKDMNMQLPTSGRSKGSLQPAQEIPSYKRGGKVKKTGLAYVHKGEKVIPKKKTKHRASKSR